MYDIIMKKYCIGIFFILFVSLSVIPLLYVLERQGASGADYVWQPSWFYALAFVTAMIAAILCEWRSATVEKRKR